MSVENPGAAAPAAPAPSVPNPHPAAVQQPPAAAVPNPLTGQAAGQNPVNVYVQAPAGQTVAPQ